MIQMWGRNCGGGCRDFSERGCDSKEGILDRVGIAPGGSLHNIAEQHETTGGA
jgi:hypothetical protein